VNPAALILKKVLEIFPGEKCTVAFRGEQVEDEDTFADLGADEEAVFTVKVCYSPSQIVDIMDVFPHEGFVYVVFEYMDLGSIDNIYQKCGARVPDIMLAYVLREILTGLHVLHHQQSRLHRNIKPGNILINSEGAVKLDVDMKCCMDGEVLYEWLGLDQGAVRTDSTIYMSPECLQGMKYTFACDIWSFGIVASELATGQYPYDTSRGLYPLMSQITEGPPPMPVGPEYSVEFVDFLAQSLQLNHETRPGTEQLLAHPFLNTSHSQDRVGFVQWLHSI